MIRSLAFLTLAAIVLVTGCAGGGGSTTRQPAAALTATRGESNSRDTVGQRVKVLTYNIHHGEGTDGRFDLDRIARLIRRTGADLIALQEVDRHTARAGGLDQPKVIAEQLGLQHAFGAAMPYQGGHYGEAILSRWTFALPRVVPLRAPEGQEPRVALEVAVQPWGEKGDAIRFIGTHLSHESPSTRLQQVAELKTSLESDPIPAILVGDFNFEPKTPQYGLILEGWLDTARKFGNAGATFPSSGPNRRIDFVFARPKDRWRVISAEVIAEPTASDHCPVLIELELLPLEGSPWSEIPGQ